MDKPWRMTERDFRAIPLAIDANNIMEADQLLANAAQLKVANVLAQYEDEQGSTEEYVELDIPREVWQALRGGE